MDPDTDPAVTRYINGGRPTTREENETIVRTAVGHRWVFAQTMAVNAASRRVMEKCGLRYVRTFHLAWDDPIDGTEEGEVEYELLRTEWEARRAEPSTAATRRRS